MTGDDDASTTHRHGRRSFLARGGAALFGIGLGAGRVAGTAGSGQDDGKRDEYVDVVLPDVPPLKQDFLYDVFMLTDPTDRRRPASEFRDCGGLDTSGPLDVYEGLLIDRAATVQLVEEGDLSKLGEIKTVRVFVPPRIDDVRIGSPYVITGGDYCEGDYVRVTAHPLSEELRGGTAPE